MKRSVVKHGSSLIVSLPATWVKKYNVKKGDALDIIEEGKRLLIATDSGTTPLELTEDISGLIPRLADRLLARSYQRGYDQIKLIHNDPELLEVIQKKVQELIGYEIMEQNNKTCLIKSISSRIDLDFENSLRRAFWIIQQMLDECYEAYKSNDNDTLKSMHLKDLEVNRLTYFCMRQISKEHYIDNDRIQEQHILYYLIETMETLGDTCKKLATELSNIKNKNIDLLELLKELIMQYRESSSYFYKPNKEKANKAYTLYKDISKDIRAIVKKSPNEAEIMALFLIKDAAHIIYHFTTMRLDRIKYTESK